MFIITPFEDLVSDPIKYCDFIEKYDRLHLQLKSPYGVRMLTPSDPEGSSGRLQAGVGSGLSCLN